MYYQLPPRAFWFWWCDGLQVYDALIVAVWLAVNILYVEQRTSLVMSYYRHPALYRGAAIQCVFRGFRLACSAQVSIMAEMVFRSAAAHMMHHKGHHMERHGFGRPVGQQILGACVLFPSS
jgi:hypothetical protein